MRGCVSENKSTRHVLILKVRARIYIHGLLFAASLSKNSRMLVPKERIPFTCGFCLAWPRADTRNEKEPCFKRTFGAQIEAIDFSTQNGVSRKIESSLGSYLLRSWHPAKEKISIEKHKRDRCNLSWVSISDTWGAIVSLERRNVRLFFRESGTSYW